MKNLGFIVLMLTVTGAGCATTRQPTQTGQLQIRVTQIESQLDDQAKELTHLQLAYEDLLHKSKQAPTVRTPVVRRIESPEPSPAPSATESSSGLDQNIIRVPVTAEDVQKGLKNAGYYTGAIDGKIGTGSKRAIKEFQTDHDLVSDGIVGKKTWAELKNYLE